MADLKHGDYLSEGWGVVKANLVPSIVTMLLMCIPIVNLQIMVNYLRAVRDFKASGKPIDIGGMFDFNNFGNNFIAMLLSGLAAGVCFLIYPLFLLVAPILADNPNMNGIDAIKAAIAWGKGNFVGGLVFMILTVLITIVAMVLCYLPVFVAGPTVMAGYWFLYADQKTAAKAAAAASGITLA